MIKYVRKLNKPYKRSDFIVGGFLKIVDGIVGIISLGYFRTSCHIWWVSKTINKSFSYLQEEFK